MSAAHSYQWDIETYDGEDIVDHDHYDLLDRAPRLQRNQKLVLVHDDEASGERAWSYVDLQTGALPAFFLDTYDRQGRKVPARFRDELRRRWDRLSPVSSR